MKTSREDTSDNHPGTISQVSPGFTLLELVVSLTIISLIVLVLYQAFSTGARVWERDNGQFDETLRLQGVLRLMEEDMIQAVPYNMNWQEGEIQLFAGGTGYISYVTGNGKGAFSGADAGLFFSTLFVDVCPDESRNCLYLFKSPYPSREFVSMVQDFRTGTEFQRQHFLPDPYLAERAVPVIRGLEELNFSYSREDFAPFTGTVDTQQHQILHEEGRLTEKEWISDELPGRIRIYFVLEEQEYAVHVPVGK